MRSPDPQPSAPPGSGFVPSFDEDAMSAGSNIPDEDEEFETRGRVGGIAADRLRSFIERIERLDEERKALASDIRDIYAESKSAGFEPSIIRRLIAIRRKEPADVEEQETLLDIYRRALGM